MADFIPRSEAELALWLANHQTQIALVGATVGLLPADITSADTEVGQASDIVSVVFGG